MGARPSRRLFLSGKHPPHWTEDPAWSVIQAIAASVLRTSSRFAFVGRPLPFAFVGNVGALLSAFVISEINDRDNAHIIPPTTACLRKLVFCRGLSYLMTQKKMKFIPQQLKAYLGTLIPND